MQERPLLALHVTLHQAMSENRTTRTTSALAELVVQPQRGVQKEALTEGIVLLAHCHAD
jgi:hypothetical protein